MDVPASANVGDRLTVAAFPGDPEPEVNPGKKGNAWVACVPLLKTDDKRVATFEGQPLVAPSGEACVAPTVALGPIS